MSLCLYLARPTDGGRVWFLQLFTTWEEATTTDRTMGEINDRTVVSVSSHSRQNILQKSYVTWHMVQVKMAPVKMASLERVPDKMEQEET